MVGQHFAIYQVQRFEMIKTQCNRSIGIGLLSLLTTVMPNFAWSLAPMCQSIFLSASVRSLNASTSIDLKIVPKSHNALRARALELSQHEILTNETQSLIANMRAEMNSKDGVGIAAPQLGVEQRIIIVKEANIFGSKEYVLINPKVTPLTSETNWSLEGCLSLPGVCGMVKRFNSVRVNYLDEKGKAQVLEAQDMFSRVLQREVDHLDGILYTDKTFLKELAKSIRNAKVRKSSEPHLRKLAELIEKDVEESYIPYSLGFDLKNRMGSELKFKNEIESLLKITLDIEETKYQGQEPSSSQIQNRAVKMNDWVKSEEHALFLYDLMNRSGLNLFKTELEYLHKKNAYFVESKRTGDGFVTYSFEKEGNSADISLLFRPPTIPEHQWLEMPEAQRIALLRNVRIPLKTFTKASVVMPTDLKPAAVGGILKS